MLIDEAGEYELARCHKIEAPEDVTAYIVERRGEALVMYWHQRGEGRLHLPAACAKAAVLEALNGAASSAEAEDGGCAVPLGRKRYLRIDMPEEAVRAAFAAARAELK